MVSMVTPYLVEQVLYLESFEELHWRLKAAKGSRT